MGLERMGAKCDVVHGYIEASTEGLHGAYILMETVTVTGTENLMMAATLAEGETVLDNAACEPEVSNLADLLRGMGAQIEGDGTRTIRIRGVRKLRGCRHRIIPDRIEAGTFAIASAITRGDVEIANCEPRHLHLGPDPAEPDGSGGRDRIQKLPRAGPGPDHCPRMSPPIHIRLFRRICRLSTWP